MGQHDKIIQKGNFNIGVSKGKTTIITGQEFSGHIEMIIKAIDETTASKPEKEEARTLLKKFIEHPVIAAIIGTSIGTLTSKII